MTVEVKIGVQHTARELVIETEETNEAIAAMVKDALASESGVLTLTDVKGKVLVFFTNEPTSDPKLFNGRALTYYGRWTYKFEQALRQGATAVGSQSTAGGFSSSAIGSGATGPGCPPGPGPRRPRR